MLGEYELNRIYQRDCIEGMSLIPDKSIDMILCDLPYGTTTCKWDTIIPFELLWAQYERIIRDNGAIVLTASQPFTTQLIASNIKLFRYELIWEKTLATNFMLVKKQPAKKHENICVFYKKQPTYNPQMGEGKPYKDSARKRTVGVHGDAVTTKKPIDNSGTRYPSSVQLFSNGNNGNFHPTQKPVALFEYLIRTYTNEGDTILDNCIGSGTTAEAAIRTGRNFIGFETEPKYVDIANQRIAQLREAA
ncbi:DNA-methyltransferase [Brevibacillus laterosporus]|uniref:DNA-methyltransferase n=1 Tax=Brevibacillus laterosporus TaxID=1465 RepID=UPI003D1CBF34